jgi:hypothetical protein
MRNKYLLGLYGAVLLSIAGGCSTGAFSCSGSGELEDDAKTTCECECFPDVIDASTPLPVPDAAPVVPDAAPIVPDAAPVVPDAGPVIPDAGAIVPDASAPMPDASAPVPDAGVSIPDAGPVIVPDAGTPIPVGDLEIPVKLQKNSNVSTLGGSEMISFGLPLAAGLITSTNQVRIVGPGGQEIIAHVESLGDWRTIPASMFRCGGLPVATVPGVRSLLIQFPYNMSSISTLDITVQLQTTPSSQLPTGVDPRTTYRLANEGSYVAADNVSEPRVWALINPQWLRCSGVVPLMNATGSVSSMAVADKGQTDFFYTTSNIYFDNLPVTNGLADYKSSGDAAEAWLYDRAQVMWNSYLRTGNPDMLREAFRNTGYYWNKLWKPSDCGTNTYCTGFFQLKNPGVGETYKDPKYSYNESLATYYWMTGDSSVKQMIQLTADRAADEIPLNSTTVPGWFTERFWAFALRDIIVRYEVFGGTANLNAVNSAVAAMRNMQATEAGSPYGPVNGCFNSDWEGGGDDGFSPWMSALLQDAFMRGYQATGNPTLGLMMYDLAKCEIDLGVEYGPIYNSAETYLVPYYGASSVSRAPLPGEGTDFEHCYDVASAVAAGVPFAPNPSAAEALRVAVRDLLTCHQNYDMPYWTRNTVGSPKYRLTPTRKYSWWYFNAHFVAYALGAQPVLP